MALSTEELDIIEDRISKMTIIYAGIKRLIMEGEAMDDKHRLSISGINELRNAFDHLMRVFAAKSAQTGTANSISCIVDDTPEGSLSPFDYCNQNMNKAYGHLYRAGYDAYDGISVYYIEQIKKLLGNVIQIVRSPLRRHWIC